MSRDIELYLSAIYKKDTDLPAEKRTGPCLRQDSASGGRFGSRIFDLHGCHCFRGQAVAFAVCCPIGGGGPQEQPFG